MMLKTYITMVRSIDWMLFLKDSLLKKPFPFQRTLWIRLDTKIMVQQECIIEKSNGGKDYTPHKHSNPMMEGKHAKLNHQRKRVCHCYVEHREIPSIGPDYSNNCFYLL